MLLYEMYENFVFMIPERTPDGSGGFVTVWKEGEPLRAAVVRNTSNEARIAEANGTKEMFTVTVKRSVQLPYHTVIKRVSDGKVFRTTSDNAESKTPLCAVLDMAQASAERWDLT